LKRQNRQWTIHCSIVSQPSSDECLHIANEHVDEPQTLVLEHESVIWSVFFTLIIFWNNSDTHIEEILRLYVIPMRQMECNFILIQDNVHMSQNLNLIEHMWDMRRGEDMWKIISFRKIKLCQLISSNWKQHYIEYGMKFLRPQFEFASICVNVYKKLFEDEAGYSVLSAKIPFPPRARAHACTHARTHAHMMRKILATYPWYASSNANADWKNAYVILIHI